MKIHVLDHRFLGTPEVISSFLVEAPEGLLLIEAGPASTAETLEAEIAALGHDLDQVRHVLVTHIHLDHAGGAGRWAARGAEIHVHPLGARHLIDPSRLLASATRIYGDRMDELWGRTAPCPRELVHPWDEAGRRLCGLEVRGYSTPGHAAHHLAFQIAGALFTGDVAGVRLPGSSYVSVPGPPPEFDLLRWQQSLESLSELSVERLYLTHFGEHEDPAGHFEQLGRRLLRCYRAVADILDESPETELLELQRRYQAWERTEAMASGMSVEQYEAYEKANPSFMSAQGFARYWRKSQELGRGDHPS